VSLTEGTVEVPVAGRIKKRYVAIPAAAALAYVTYRWWQARRDGAAPAPGADGTYATADLSEYGLSTAGGPTTVTGNTGSVVTDGTRPESIDTNAEWTARAIEVLTTQGYEGTVVAAALGDYLARRTLDKTEATIVRAAVAVAGQPPVGGPYPVLEQAATDTGTLPAPTNLRGYGSPTTSQIGLQWDRVSGASHYRIYRTDLGDEPIGDSLDTKFNARGLQPHHTYSFYVRAVGTTGKLGGKSSVYTAHTADVKLGKPTGLKATAITRTSFRVSCNRVPGATYYRWYLNGHPTGASDQPYRDFTGLRANSTYSVTVAADTTSQKPGPVSSPLRVKTKR
jgi:hypothetical protein